MNNPCIGPNGMRYMFIVKKSDNVWVSRRLFVVSKIDDLCMMGQYLRDMWYMETLCPDDIREFMIIPINKHTIFLLKIYSRIIFPGGCPRPLHFIASRAPQGADFK